MNDRDLYRIADDVGEGWLEEWAREGVTAIEAYLASRSAFDSLLEDDQLA